MDRAASKTFSLKLLVNTNSNKVLFGEADKDLVDFLFSLLSLPLGTVAHLLRFRGMVGSLGHLHSSLDNLPVSYVQPGFDKNLLLVPKPQPGLAKNSLLLPTSQVDHALLPGRQEACYYRCNYSSGYGTTHEYVTDVRGQECPSCRSGMTTKMSFIRGKVGDGAATIGVGYVQERIVYMITDDLTVTPMSMISSIAMFNKLEVKDVGELEERTVKIGVNEALKLLKASLHSETVLTYLFLVKKTQAGAAT